MKDNKTFCCLCHNMRSVPDMERKFYKAIETAVRWAARDFASENPKDSELLYYCSETLRRKNGDLRAVLYYAPTLEEFGNRRVCIYANHETGYVEASYSKDGYYAKYMVEDENLREIIASSTDTFANTDRFILSD